MRLADMRLIEGVERVPLGDEIERYVTDAKHVKASWQRAAVISPWINREEPPRPRLSLETPFTNPKLTLDEQPDGSVVIHRPDGMRVHVYASAMVSTLGISTKAESR